MKKSFLFVATTMLVLTLSSCKKDLSDILVGTWSVAEIKYEPASGTTTIASNAGTITFLGSGSGSYNIDYGLGDDDGEFTWSATDNNETVAINGGFSVITGQYTVLTNKKNQQVWQQASANGDKRTYTLEK